MPLVLSKLPCGVIYTEDFRRYLADVHDSQHEDYPRQVLTLDYVRCASGPLKGRAWWHLHWIPAEAAPEYRCFRIGHVRVHIPKSAQHGLRERCLEYRDGRVVVLP